MIRIAVGREAEDHGAWGEEFRWQGTAGEEKRVSCYTNGKTAELWLNGQSLGRKEVRREDGGRAVWTVPYEAGTLEARTEGAEDRLSTPGKATRLVIRKAEGLKTGDVVQLEAMLLDDAGRPAGDEMIVCQTVGDLTLLGLENGQCDDLTPYSENRRSTREGTLTAYLRIGKESGEKTVTFRTKSGLTASQHLRPFP